MPEPPSFHSDKASRFFDNHLIYLYKLSIPDNRERCYAIPVGEFIKAQEGHKIGSFSSDSIAQYF